LLCVRTCICYAFMLGSMPTSDAFQANTLLQYRTIANFVNIAHLTKPSLQLTQAVRVCSRCARTASVPVYLTPPVPGHASGDSPLGVWPEPRSTVSGACAHIPTRADLCSSRSCHDL